jgi:hypothetical protein
MQVLAGPLSLKAYKLTRAIDALPGGEEATRLTTMASELADGISKLEEFLRVHLNAPYQPNTLEK